MFQFIHFFFFTENIEMELNNTLNITGDDREGTGRYVSCLYITPEMWERKIIFSLSFQGKVEKTLFVRIHI